MFRLVINLSGLPKSLPWANSGSQRGGVKRGHELRRPIGPSSCVRTSAPQGS